ncbi:MAG: folylpolyglutamate synthase/dihydrofolate synthase family protein [Candidatus Alcyoniella australis]|nr:folylpolyglutamate synthase/dihydrofolate synthase family protein [Candidatus Alcyoniella australis]
MSSSYQAALERLYSLERFGIKLGLDNVGRLLRELGDPQLSCPAVHIGGTNGKGSVARTIAQVLHCAGYDCGLYTSPHLQRFNERIWQNGDQIDDGEVGGLFDECWSAMERVLAEQPSAQQRPMTFFELVTAMAALYFSRRSAQIAVWEVGLGGRLDATNLVQPQVTLITSVAIEHEQWLGSSLAQIAAEKAGIIKPGVPVLTAVSHPEALEVIESIAAERGAPLMRLGHDFSYTRLSKSRMNYDGLSLDLRDLRISLAGEHQLANAALAIAALELIQTQFSVNENDIRRGLSQVRWPGRLERMGEQGQIVLDGAHNTEAAQALAAALAESPPRGKRLMLIGMGEDKDLAGFFELLGPHVDRAFLTRSQRPQAVDPRRLAAVAGPYIESIEICDDVPAGLAASRAQLREGDELLVCGSLFVVGEARQIIQDEQGAR